MRLRLLALVAPALAACHDDPWDDPGIARPGTLRLVLATDDGVAVTAASAVLEELRITHCSGRDGLTMVRSLVSVETTAAYFVEGDWWCGIEAAFEPPLVVSAEGPDGSTLAAELDVPAISVPVRPSMYVDGHTLMLQLGTDGWLSDAELPFVPGEELAIGPGDEAHDLLVESLEEASALWLDVGADGRIGDDELDSGPIATGPERER